MNHKGDSDFSILYVIVTSTHKAGAATDPIAQKGIGGFQTTPQNCHPNPPQAYTSPRPSESRTGQNKLPSKVLANGMLNFP